MKQYQRILLLKTDHIGDALWSFPAIRAVRSAFPHAQIDMLCTPYLVSVFRHLSDLTEVIEYNPAAPLQERIHTLMKLRQSQYEVALILGPVDKVNHLAFFSGARERIGYAYAGNILHGLTRSLYLTEHAPHPSDTAIKLDLPLPHEVSSMLALTEKIGTLPPENPVLFFPLAPDEVLKSAVMLKNLCPGKTNYAAIHLCTKSFAYGWNETAFVRLTAKLQNAFPEIGWIVTAGPAEEPYLPQYRASLSALDIPIVSGMQLAATAALLTNMRLLISWDTGVVHLASAVGTPVVDIFPKDNFDYCLRRWGPWGKQSISLMQQQAPTLSDDFNEILSAATNLLVRSGSTQ